MRAVVFHARVTIDDNRTADVFASIAHLASRTTRLYKTNAFTRRTRYDLCIETIFLSRVL